MEEIQHTVDSLGVKKNIDFMKIDIGCIFWPLGRIVGL